MAPIYYGKLLLCLLPMAVLAHNRPLPVLRSSTGGNGNQYSMSTLGEDQLDDPEVRRGLARNYVQEAFFSYPEPPIELPVMLLLSNTSFLLSDPAAAAAFEGRVRRYDVQGEIDKSRGEFFGQVYKAEDQIMFAAERQSANSTFPNWKLDPRLSKRLMLLRLRTVFSVARNHLSSEQQRHGVGDFISRKMGQMGLVVGMQQFAPRQFHKTFFGGSPELPLGTNLFALLPGSSWGTEEDRVFVVGAHWDTFGISGGLNDNGSGVVALLEVARILVESRCKPKHSVMFVAFDQEEMAAQGSLQFVSEYLIPKILRRFNQSGISGAIIVDTILNFNDTKGSQDISDYMKDLTPSVAEAVRENEFKGDFINLFKRQGVDDDLAKAFTAKWHQTSVHPLFTSSVDLPSNSSADALESSLDLLRSDHARFWFTADRHIRTLPAILLTDTGPNRGVMRECYHEACDSAQPNPASARQNTVNNDPAFAFLREDSPQLDFLMDTVNAIVAVAADVTGAECRHGFPKHNVETEINAVDDVGNASGEGDSEGNYDVNEEETTSEADNMGTVGEGSSDFEGNDVGESTTVTIKTNEAEEDLNQFPRLVPLTGNGLEEILPKTGSGNIPRNGASSDSFCVSTPLLFALLLVAL